MTTHCSLYPQPARETMVLGVGLLAPDRGALRRLLSRSSWRLRVFDTCREALSQFGNDPAPVVVCERRFADGNWIDMLRAGAGLAHPPSVIVASALSDESLWAEALSLGAFDVLATPFERKEVFHSLFLAWLRWKTSTSAKRAVRDVQAV